MPEHERTFSMESLPPSQYGEYYFEHNFGVPYQHEVEHWSRFFGRVADAIVRQLAPRTVLDAGCAKGFLVSALRQRGVEAWGIDISEVAIDQADSSVKGYVQLGAIGDELPDGFPRSFDLVTCIETAEHLPQRVLRDTVGWLCSQAGHVIFSSVPDGYAEATHLSVMPTEEWSALFAEEGYYRNFDVDVTCLAPWAVVYERGSTAFPLIVKRHERHYIRAKRENEALRGEVVRLEGCLGQLDGTVRAMGVDLDEVRAAAVAEAEPDWQAKIDAARIETELARAQVEKAQAELEAARDTARQLDEALVAGRLELLAERDAAIGAAAEAEQARRRADWVESQLAELRVQITPLTAAAEQLELTMKSETWRMGNALMAPVRFARRRRH